MIFDFLNGSRDGTCLLSASTDGGEAYWVLGLYYMTLGGKKGKGPWALPRADEFDAFGVRHRLALGRENEGVVRAVEAMRSASVTRLFGIVAAVK